MSRLAATLLLMSCTILAAQSRGAEPASEASYWSRYRGPQGTGVSGESNLPVKFGTEAISWETDLPVIGHSSPVVWGERIFVTGAAPKGNAVERRVVCLDRNSGKVLWNQVAAVGPGELLHKMNSWATPSCATDGERVIAFFGAGGLHCFSNDGQPIWSRQFGDFPGRWGVGASPIFVNGLVVQNCDAEGASFLVAVDKRTGKDVWRTPRESKPRGGWSTPIVIEFEGRRELVLNGEFGVDAYDPETGNPLWRCRGFNGRGTPAPAWGHGMLYVVNGKAGDVYSVRPGGKADVTDSHMAWHTPRSGGRDLPSPVLADECLVVISMGGIVSGYDAHDGEELWKQRLGGNYSSSPVAAGGLVYALSEDGQVNVIRPGKKFELIARNKLGNSQDEVFRSSIAISNGQLLIRSDRRLYCVGQ
jgi:outer membrane protein assembly factor BamB